ncbi:MAG: epoxyqueuosine reductase QueH [Treponema sp.]|nr:epoxyqueuosine reductase QueH [Treponema sp.]
MNLLFHCCCAPCTIAPVESLCGEGISPTLFWYNPNIHPSTEYQNRRDALFAFAGLKNLPLVAVDEYGLYSFLHDIGGETERCTVCYRVRLEWTAARAVELGFDAFGTSLFISPYQQHDLISRIGDEVAERYGVEFLYRDFRPLFRESQTQSRALGLYMQKYCGCIFSEADRYAEKNK